MTDQKLNLIVPALVSQAYIKITARFLPHGIQIATMIYVIFRIGGAASSVLVQLFKNALAVSE
jgi:hypothetical protein